MEIHAAFLDVDGVLVPIENSWAYIHKRLGVEEEARRHLKLYLEGRISYEEWMRLDTELWLRALGGRAHRSTLKRILGEVEIPSESIEAIRILREAGIRVALLSGGVDLMVSRVARSLGVERWMANRLIFDNEGFLVPGGIGEVEASSKDKAFLALAEKLGVDPGETAYIGDSQWDLPAFRVAGLSILLWRHESPPPPMLRDSVDHVVKSLRKAVEIVVGGRKH